MLRMKPTRLRLVGQQRSCSHILPKARHFSPAIIAIVIFQTDKRISGDGIRASESKATPRR